MCRVKEKKPEILSIFTCRAGEYTVHTDKSSIEADEYSGNLVEESN